MGKKYRLYGRKASRTGGLRKRYKEHDHGTGGVKCPCCGADDSKTVRRREKQKMKNDEEIKEYVEKFAGDPEVDNPDWSRELKEEE